MNCPALVMLDLRGAAGLLAGAGPSSGRMGAGMAGSYRLLRLIGRGGTSRVYAARHIREQSGRQVAVKIGLPGTASLQRFRREQQVLRRMSHANIAAIDVVGTTAAGRSYLVMELVRGRTITRWCREHRASLRQRVDLFDQLCGAVAHVHRHRVAHGDLKPENILVTSGARVKLIDFGAARCFASNTRGRAHPVGGFTPAYAAPEQMLGNSATMRADVYALGLLLQELLEGENPRASATMPAAVLVDRALNPKIPRLTSRLPLDLDAIVAKATRLSPKRRYPHAAALRRDLRRAIARRRPGEHFEPVAAPRY